MSEAEKLAAFCARVSYADLSHEARHQLKIRVLDAIGCAIGALSAEPILLIRALINDFGGYRHCTMIGAGRTAPDRAAFYNSALVRYLDFNDSYLAPRETCHPSDNFGAILAACEYAHRSGQELMTSLALAYHVQCRLSDVAPVRSKGFDHTTQGSYSVAAGVSHALALDQEKTANALAISGTAYNALRVTRTGALSNWKGLAYANMAMGAVHAVFLAQRGITGPKEVFEGDKGFMEAIAGRFEIDWAREDLERVTRTIVKKYNAEVHSQSVIEGILELRAKGLSPSQVAAIEIDIFDVAYNIIGGGEEGDKSSVSTKEEADHSLPYIVAVALLDGQVMPEQYRTERIKSRDVQELVRKVAVRKNDSYSRRFPAEMPCRVAVRLRDGRWLRIERADYEGFTTRPIAWRIEVEKFERLARAHAEGGPRRDIIQAVGSLDDINAADLAHLLGRVSSSHHEAKAEGDYGTGSK